jgi:hypothetical protein
MFSQESYKPFFRPLWLATAILFVANHAIAGSIARAAGPDPVLTGAAPGPCAVVGPDYVDGVDATGPPVAPAGVSSPDVLGSSHALVTVPLRQHRRGEVTVAVDLARLAPPPCKPPPSHRR